MKKYYISHNTNQEEKEHNIDLYNKVRTKGNCLGGEWNGDYYVSTFEYLDNIYELWDNMEYGIMSEVVEYERSEYYERHTN